MSKRSGAISTAAGGDHGGGDSSVSSSVLQKLRGFFSPRKLSPQSPSSPEDQRIKQRRGHPADGVESPLTTAIAGTSSTTTTADFERVFRYLDQNGDGKLSPSELRSYMRAVGEELSEEDAAAVVESTDSDGDGLLGLEDFVRLVDVGGDEEERIRDLMEAFGAYEAKKGGRGGRITPKSLRRALRRLGERKTTEECEAMIRRFDLDGDGVLSFDEFKVMML